MVRAIRLAAVVAAMMSAGVALAQEPPPEPPPEFLPAVPESPADGPRPPEGPGSLPKPRPVEPVPLDYVPPVADGEFVGEAVIPRRYWLTADLLQWWTKGDRPPVVIAGTQMGNFSNVGVLGDPNTVPLFGGGTTLTETRVGFRVGLGVYLDDAARHGLGVTFTRLEPAISRFNSGSLAGMGGPLSGTFPFPVPLARPYFLPGTGQQAIGVGTAFPNLSTGVALAESHGDFSSGEFNYTGWLSDGPLFQFGVLAGYRILYLHEFLNVYSAGVITDSELPQLPNGSGGTADRYRTLNYFHGGQVGLLTRLSPAGKRWSADLTTKLAVGYTFSEASAAGNLISSVNGTLPFGLLTGPGNNFARRTAALTFAPEMDLNFTWRVTDCVKAFAGYSILYWDDVRRPGNQVNSVVVPFTPGAMTVPAGGGFTGTTTDFFAQGLNFGFEVRY